MFNQSHLVEELARQRSAELHAVACRQRLVEGTARLSRTRAYAGRMLIMLGTRLAPTDVRATNRKTKLAAR